MKWLDAAEAALQDEVEWLDVGELFRRMLLVSGVDPRPSTGLTMLIAALSLDQHRAQRTSRFELRPSGQVRLRPAVNRPGDAGSRFTRRGVARTARESLGGPQTQVGVVDPVARAFLPRPPMLLGLGRLLKPGIDRSTGKNRLAESTYTRAFSERARRRWPLLRLGADSDHLRRKTDPLA